MALIHAFLVITLRANQIVSGLALTIFAGAAGLSAYLGNDLTLADSPARYHFPSSTCSGSRTRRSSARSSSASRCWSASMARGPPRRPLPRPNRAGPQRPCGRRVTGNRGCDGHRRHDVPLSPRSSGRPGRRRGRLLQPPDHAAVGDRYCRRRRVDRDPRSSSSPSGAPTLPRGRLPLRRLLRAAVRLAGAGLPPGCPVRGIPGASY